MPNIAFVGDLLPLIGTPAFLPSLLSYIRDSPSRTLPLDPVIFQAILLCIVAGDKHLLLHTPEEDIGLVVRLAAWISSTIFDLTTHKLKIKPRREATYGFTDAANTTDRSPFLRSLFLRLDRNEVFPTPRNSKTLNSRNEHSPSRNKKTRPTRYSRSASFPSESSFTTATSLQHPDNHFSFPRSQSISSSSPAVTDQPRSSAISPAFAPRTPVLHAHTDPASFSQRATRPEFPRALVVSGLEHAHMLDQRALAQVLTEKRVVFEGRAQDVTSSESGKVTDAGRGPRSLDNRSTAFDDTDGLEDADYCGVWNVPEDFITIYVCPWDPRERPNIHRSLLDKFAMSTTVVVQRSVRQAMRALPFSPGYPILYPHAHSNSHSNLPTPSLFRASPLPQSQTPPFATHALPSSHAHHHGYPHAAPPMTAKQVLPPAFLDSLRTTCRRTYITPVLLLYLTDLFSAARHHPLLDGTFLTARAVQDAEDLARAGRVLGMDPTGGELVRSQDSVKYSYAEDGYVESITRARHDGITDEVGSGSVAIDADADRIHPYTDDPNFPGAVAQDVNLDPLYVSEADIARIVPRVITHRLRVRDGPQDEVLSSAVFGATFGLHDGRDYESAYDTGTRSTVKDILVGILGDV